MCTSISVCTQHSTAHSTSVLNLQITITAPELQSPAGSQETNATTTVRRKHGPVLASQDEAIDRIFNKSVVVSSEVHSAGRPVGRWRPNHCDFSPYQMSINGNTRHHDALWLYSLPISPVSISRLLFTPW